jgi:hypothetical protein
MNARHTSQLILLFVYDVFDGFDLLAQFVVGPSYLLLPFGAVLLVPSDLFQLFLLLLQPLLQPFVLLIPALQLCLIFLRVGLGLFAFGLQLIDPILILLVLAVLFFLLPTQPGHCLLLLLVSAQEVSTWVDSYSY